jgi:hypothetical protein
VSQSPARITYTIDRDDRIRDTGGAWSAFAEANHGPEADAVIGKPLWTFISGATVTDLWRLLVARARAGRPVAVTIRCDAPELRRLVAMTVHLGEANGVVFNTEVIEEHERGPVRLFDPDAERSGEHLLMCAWCHAIRARPDEPWQPLEVALDQLGLLEAMQLPRTTHGICDACFDTVTSTS